MKKYLLFILLPLFSLNAQNGMVTSRSNDGVHSRSVTAPEYQTKKLSDELSIHFPNQKKAADNSKNSFHLKIVIEGIWGALALGDGNDFWEIIDKVDIQSDTIELTAPEGLYDFCLWCSPDDVHYAFVTKEQILIDKDTEMTLKTAEAIHKIDVAAVDETGAPFASKDLSEYQVESFLCMHSSVGIFFRSGVSDTTFRQKTIYVNDLGSRFIFYTTLVTFLKDKNIAYCVELPAISEGLSKDTVLANRPEAFLLHRQMFDLYPPQEDMFSGYALNIVRNNGGFLLYMLAFSKKWTFDISKPYQLYTNSRLSAGDRDINVFFAPLLCADMFDFNIGLIPYIGFSTIIISEEEKIIKDDFFLYHDFWYAHPEDFLQIYSRLPILKQYEARETVYNDYRTPILCYQGANTKSYLFGKFLFLGKNNEQRFIDTDRLIEVKRNGETIFHDSIYIFQRHLFDITPEKITMNILNDNNFFYGRNMANKSTIEFDLKQSDCNPPTLTMLRIVDGEGHIRIGVEDLENAQIEMTAGDFEIKLQTQYYFAKPAIDISWSLDGKEFYPLEAVEDESKFHKSSGNFFNVGLASLKNHDVQNKWITVKIVLTDETGNYISQLLEPLFYCGNLVDIEDVSSGDIRCLVIPNPAAGDITIRAEEALQRVEIFDMSGKAIFSKEAIGRKEIQCPIGMLPKGVYLVRAQLKNGKIATEKVVLQ